MTKTKFFKNNNNDFLLLILLSIFYWIICFDYIQAHPITVTETKVIHQIVQLPPVYIVQEPEEVEVLVEEEEPDLIAEHLANIPDSDRMEWFIEYRELIADVEDAPETLEDVFTDEEIYLAARMVETETYGADFDSKCNVASVLFNRIESEEFPNTINGVIKQSNQFAYYRHTISEDTILALEFAFEIEDTTNGALYFHSGRYTSTFNGRPLIFQDNIGHYFY